MKTRGADKKQLIKDRAIEMLVRDGFEGFSMHKLARACDISVATLYIYYEDKDDLINKIGAEVSGVFFRACMEGFHPEMSLAEGLAVQWHNRAQYLLNYPHHLEFWNILKFSSYGDNIIKLAEAESRSANVDYVNSLIQRGEIASMSPTLFYTLAYGPLFSLIQFNADGMGVDMAPFAVDDTMMAEALSTVIKGLRRNTHKAKIRRE